MSVTYEQYEAFVNDAKYYMQRLLAVVDSDTRKAYSKITYYTEYVAEELNIINTFINRLINFRINELDTYLELYVDNSVNQLDESLSTLQQFVINVQQPQIDILSDSVDDVSNYVYGPLQDIISTLEDNDLYLSDWIDDVEETTKATYEYVFGELQTELASIQQLIVDAQAVAIQSSQEYTDLTAAVLRDERNVMYNSLSAAIDETEQSLLSTIDIEITTLRTDIDEKLEQITKGLEAVTNLLIGSSVDPAFNPIIDVLQSPANKQSNAYIQVAAMLSAKNRVRKRRFTGLKIPDWLKE